MQSMPRRGPTVRLMGVLVLVGACTAVGGWRGADGMPLIPERLGFQTAVHQAAVIASRIPGWLELVERRDVPASRWLPSMAAGLPAVLMLGLAVAWWPARPPGSQGRLRDARLVAGPRAPPAALPLM